MAQVLIVSNRLPISVSKVDGKLTFATSIGGLATGLQDYAKNRRSTWIGWPGIASDDLTVADRKQIVKRLAKSKCKPVFLTQKQVDQFYNGFSNELLWPLFHSFKITDSRKRASWWRAYREVNQLFADATKKLVQPSSQIWVHDYQLLLVPEMLRQYKPKAHIGFFLHIPFPPAKEFTKFPEAKKLVRGMLNADLVGFHTPRYAYDFLATCLDLKFGDSEDGQVIVGSRSVRVTDFPMGIDYKKFADASKLPEVKKAVRAYKKQYRGKKVIAAVDRLDISKGFVERLVAYREYLAQNPKMHGKVVFVLVGAPSRTDIPVYQRLAKNVDKLAADINAMYGSERWQPVNYINHAIPFEEVTALFQIARVAFIAPLRDGMNLVAKEFIASKHDGGVLILSETAGAAEELHDAIVVNHSEPSSLVDALDQALSMRKREVRARLKRMQRHLSEHTVQVWAGDFMKTLQQPLPKIRKSVTRKLNEKTSNKLKADFRVARSRALFLDYDGTLAPIVTRPEDAAPSPALLKTLKKLGEDSSTHVFIISGRSRTDLELWLGDLPVNLIAEHGAFERPVGNKRWRASSTVSTDWKQQVKPILELYAKRTAGAYVEEKSTALVWHYREAAAYAAQKNLVILKKALQTVLKANDLQAHDGKKILEIKHKDTSKGAQVSKKIAEHRYSFILTIGDDYTDESMFKVLPETGYSIKVGTGRSAAKFRVKDTDEALDLLKQLA
jgi:trehalose 6-phosphate synthase/phosphatase